MPRLKERPPTAEEMQIYAKRYSPEQWKELCKHPEFIEAFLTSILQSQRIAIQILTDKK